LDEQEERRLLVGGRLHRRADAEEPHRAVNAGTCFRAAAQTSPATTSDLQCADSVDYRRPGSSKISASGVPTAWRP
jgi:hypothetical protein